MRAEEGFGKLVEIKLGLERTQPHEMLGITMINWEGLLCARLSSFHISHSSCSRRASNTAVLLTAVYLTSRTGSCSVNIYLSPGQVAQLLKASS